MGQASCLIVIDMQEGIFKLKHPIHCGPDVIDNINKLLDWARENSICVFFSRHENSSFLKRGSADWEIVDGLKVMDSDTFINKKHPSVFKETELFAILKENSTLKVCIAGLISNGCVRDACLDAIQYDFDVLLIKDAHSTFYANAEKVIGQVNDEMEKAGASILSTEELLKSPIEWINE